MDTHERLHAIDNLRAAMMWLGIVLHVADLHMATYEPMVWHDPKTSLVADVIVSVIHAFRMPVFFIIAGFLVALLVERRGVGGMVQNRLRRLGIPFLVFWPLLFATTIVLTSLFARQAGSGVSEGLFNLASMPLMPDGTRFQTLHLWFLEELVVLVLLAAAGFLIVRRIPVALRSAGVRLCGGFASSGWASLAIVIPLALISQKYPRGVISSSALFIPRPSEWAFSGLCLLFGIGLYHARATLLPRYQALCWHFAIVGTAAFLVMINLDQLATAFPGLVPRSRFVSGLLYNSCGWLWSLALFGAFSRYIDQVNPVLRYASDSSYWVYLVHLPLLIAVEIALYSSPVHALLKMSLNIVVTSCICLISYHFLVRRTAIGRLLDGGGLTAPFASVAGGAAIRN